MIKNTFVSGFENEYDQTQANIGAMVQGRPTGIGSQGDMVLNGESQKDFFCITLGQESQPAVIHFAFLWIAVV
jgi:hypothetical protein